MFEADEAGYEIDVKDAPELIFGALELLAVVEAVEDEMPDEVKAAAWSLRALVDEKVVAV